MELRPPPRPSSPGTPDRVARGLLVAVVVLALVLIGLVLRGAGRDASAPADAERLRQVAAKLQAAGVRDEAARLYGEVLGSPGLPSAERARIAYSLGTGFLEAGRYEAALRWLYEAESWDDGGLAEELGPKIVHALERLGRHHAAQAVLERRTALDGGETRRADSDTVVARIGRREIRLSELDRALDDMPPQLAERFRGAAGRRELLRTYVAEELLWEKAKKLEIDDDPDVRRSHALLLKQLAVARFVEREVLGKIEIDEADLANFFAAHRERYAAPPEKEGAEPRLPALAEVRPAVERDYRLMKTQAAYGELIESELAAAEVELFPERLSDGT